MLEEKKSIVKELPSKYAFFIAGIVLLSNATVSAFFITLSGKVELAEIIPTAIDFVLSMFLLQEHQGARKFALIRAVLGLAILSFIQDIGESFTLAWFETMLVQLFLSGSLIFLLVWQKSLWSLILGGIFATLYISYLALIVFIRFNA